MAGQGVVWRARVWLGGPGCGMAGQGVVRWARVWRARVLACGLRPGITQECKPYRESRQSSGLGHLVGLQCSWPPPLPPPPVAQQLPSLGTTGRPPTWTGSELHN